MKVRRLYSNEILPANQPIAEEKADRSFYCKQIRDRRKQFLQCLKKDWYQREA